MRTVTTIRYRRQKFEHACKYPEYTFKYMVASCILHNSKLIASANNRDGDKISLVGLTALRLKCAFLVSIYLSPGFLQFRVEYF